MFNTMKIAVLIPARNEAGSVEHVVAALRKLPAADESALIDRIVVCDNGSTDRTAELARSAGAEVVFESQIGYGAACLRALDAVRHGISRADVIVFVDADQSVVVGELPALLRKLAEGFDLVIGVRAVRLRETGSMSWPQRVGNTLARALIALIWRRDVHDLGPFRAIRWPALQALAMRDRRFGWTVEMQVKAIQKRMRVAQLDVSCRRRTGRSKISGTAMGVVRAGYDIVATILCLAVQAPCHHGGRSVRRSIKPK